jgi:Putative adhesin
MNIRIPDARYGRRTKRGFLVLAAASALFLSLAAPAYAQRSFSRKYPARQNVRLELYNRFGRIEVLAWNRNEIKVTANMDSPAARFNPERSEDALVINVVNDNRGRGEIGDVNFQIWVPSSTTVEIVTRRGNIIVRDVTGSRVRARSFEGDIELTGIRAGTVMAENTMGNITYDGEIMSGGEYVFSSTQGDISISIPANAAFRLVATAPMTRNIALGPFPSGGLSFIGEGRKVVGNIGDGGASLTVTNLRGSIKFFRR